MKNQKLSFSYLLLALFFTSTIKATTYYVCDCATNADPNCIVGNDSNNGITINTPWRSITKVNTIVNTLLAGDQILFAKGGSWINAQIGDIHNYNSTATNPIIFDSYQPSWGGTAKPILTELRPSYNLFTFSDGGDATHDEGYTIRNLDLRGGGSDQIGIVAWNDADYITMENLNIFGFSIGVYCAGANLPEPGADRQNQYMKLLNSSITNCSSQGFLGGADYLLIEGCFFNNNGFDQAVFNHNIYLDSDGNNIIVRNNELYKSAVVNGKADGVSLVVHGVHDNLLIEGNYVHEDIGMVTGNAWGIAVDPGYNEPEGFVNLVIRGNLVVNMFNVGIGVASCAGAIIENNVIINESAADLRAIAAPDRSRGNDDTAMTNVTVRNNSIYLRNANADTIGILVGEEGTNHKIISNVISLDNGNGFQMNLPNSNYTSVDYNRMEVLNNARWESGQTLSTWSSTRGFDLNSSTGNPLFTSPGSPNFNLRPLSSSPLINAGHPTLSATTDYLGISRNGISDIGAYEYNSVLSNANDETNFQKKSVICYPNPTNGQITLKSDDLLIGSKYTVYNYVGQTMLSGKIDAEKTVLDLNNSPNGLLLIVIGDKETKQIFKVIKQ